MRLRAISYPKYYAKICWKNLAGSVFWEETPRPRATVAQWESKNIRRFENIDLTILSSM